MKLKLRQGDLSLDRVALMGILNVTPDSFSDGGLWREPDRAVARGVEMVAEGAAIVDVGGESTRPGADAVDEAEELDRVMPVIERLVRRVGVPISIDTRKPSVAQRALQAGAALVNDTSGEESGRDIDEVIAAAGAGVVVMHSRGSPVSMTSLTAYGDVVSDVGRFLKRRTTELETAGVHRQSIVVDPGFGFAKTPEQNLELLRRLDEIVALGYPVLVGTSRKSFIGRVLGVAEDQRVEGTAATVVWAIVKGARLLRVHDVAPIARAVTMTEAIAGASSGHLQPS